MQVGRKTGVNRDVAAAGRAEEKCRLEDNDGNCCFVCAIDRIMDVTLRAEAREQMSVDMSGWTTAN